jgi:hypothetical protein
VVLELSDCTSRDGTVQNLSPSGVLIEGDSAAIHPGAELGLRFSLPSDSSGERFEARVTRVTERGFAARFQRLTAPQIHTLWMAFLENAASTGQLDDCPDLEPSPTGEERAAGYGGGGPHSTG